MKSDAEGELNEPDRLELEVHSFVVLVSLSPPFPFGQLCRCSSALAGLLVRS